MRSAYFKVIILLLQVYGIISCSHQEIYFKYHTFANATWNRDNPAVFNAKIEDNSQSYDLSIALRNNAVYPFSNVWLFIDYKTPDGTCLTDTVGADLADISGKWKGEGLSLYNYSIPYKTSFLFPDTGNYIFTVRHGMKEKNLKGISDIGLKISKNSIE